MPPLLNPEAPKAPPPELLDPLEGKRETRNIILACIFPND